MSRLHERFADEANRLADELLERGRFDGIADLAEASALTITHTCVPQKIDELSGLPLYLFPSNEWIEVGLLLKKRARKRDLTRGADG